jgi:hypothetical protein
MTALIRKFIFVGIIDANIDSYRLSIIDYRLYVHFINDIELSSSLLITKDNSPMLTRLNLDDTC